MWLLLAAVAEFPPAVSPAYSLAHLIFAHHSCNVVGAHCPESKRYCGFLSGMSTRNSELNSILPEMPGPLNLVRP
jgi:hypothetical protein